MAPTPFYPKLPAYPELEPRPKLMVDASTITDNAAEQWSEWLRSARQGRSLREWGILAEDLVLAIKYLSEAHPVVTKGGKWNGAMRAGAKDSSRTSLVFERGSSLRRQLREVAFWIQGPYLRPDTPRFRTSCHLDPGRRSLCLEIHHRQPRCACAAPNGRQAAQSPNTHGTHGCVPKNRGLGRARNRKITNKTPKKKGERSTRKRVLSARRFNLDSRGPKGRGRGHKHGAGRDPQETKDQHRDRDLQQLVEATARLTLKLADAQQVLLQDCGFTWFVSTEPGGILPTMFGVSAEWKKLKESSPHLIKSPLPTLMMTCILEELVARMQRTVAEESMQKAALQAGWCTEAGGWADKQWDPIKKELVDTKEAPVTLTALETIVKEIQTFESRATCTTSRHRSSH